MAERIEVKWINGQWRSFGQDRSHFSAGVGQIVDLVEDELRPRVAPGEHIEWRSTGSKLVAEITDKPSGKLSKSDQD